MNMKKWIGGLTAAALVLCLFAGCSRETNQASSRAETKAVYDEGVSYEMAADSAAGSAANGSLSAAQKLTGTAAPLPQNRKWIITMNLNAETEDLDGALEAITARIQALDGYVEGQSVTGSSATRQRLRTASLTVRIPADRVDGFVEEVSGLTNVVFSSRNVQDITLSYSDTQGRVTALETEQARLLELMEQAETMSDLLEIESRLTEVRYQLESYGSALRLYDNQVDYATVELSITEVEKYTPVEEPGFWQRITSGLADSIADLGDTLVNLVVWLLVDLPYLAVLALAAWGVTALTRRCLRRRKAKKEKEQK